MLEKYLKGHRITKIYKDGAFVLDNGTKVVLDGAKPWGIDHEVMSNYIDDDYDSVFASSKEGNPRFIVKVNKRIATQRPMIGGIEQFFAETEDKLVSRIDILKAQSSSRFGDTSAGEVILSINIDINLLEVGEKDAIAQAIVFYNNLDGKNTERVTLLEKLIQDESPIFGAFPRD